LSAQIKALEARPKAMNYAGVWREDITYEKNDCVTHTASWRVCRETTRTAKPGESGSESRACKPRS
jgi:hypothetical protein